MKNEIFKGCIIVAAAILIAAFSYRTKPDFFYEKGEWATVRVNKTNGERCLLADGVFRRWDKDSIAKEADRIRFYLSDGPLIFCSGEVPPGYFKLIK
jgi:hypothetical protein